MGARDTRCPHPAGPPRSAPHPSGPCLILHGPFGRADCASRLQPYCASRAFPGAAERYGTGSRSRGGGPKPRASRASTAPERALYRHFVRAHIRQPCLTGPRVTRSVRGRYPDARSRTSGNSRRRLAAGRAPAPVGASWAHRVAARRRPARACEDYAQPPRPSDGAASRWCAGSGSRRSHEKARHSQCGF